MSREGTIMSQQTVYELPYASPQVVRSGAKSGWVGAILFGTGLGLIVLGGCFLIGVMINDNGNGLHFRRV